MNITHLRYAVEISRAGSINRASETLMMGQPNLSRAVKELESSLGITIFDRSAKGMFVTPEGEEFLRHAKEILQQIDDLESLYRLGTPAKQRFSLSAPRAGYISQAFAHFSEQLCAECPTEIFYTEADSTRTIENVLRSDYKLGIIRYAQSSDRYYKTMLEEKRLAYEMIAEFSHVLLLHEEHPLAQQEEIRLAELGPYFEIIQTSSPGSSLAELTKEARLTSHVNQLLFVSERASQYELLAENRLAFHWASPTPHQILNRYGLVQRPCVDHGGVYKDVLIYHEDHLLTPLDKLFITQLCDSKRRCF